jgi:hypothetical protein
MLLEPELDLRLGDRLSLALFAKPEQRLDLRARVVRSDEQKGLALAFDPMPAALSSALEGLIAGLPCIERTSGAASPAAMLGEITRRDR